MESLYSVRAECAKPTCTVMNQNDRGKFEVKAYEGHELAAHQLVLIPLYAHTQHGSCGLNVTQDGVLLL